MALTKATRAITGLITHFGDKLSEYLSAHLGGYVAVGQRSSMTLEAAVATGKNVKVSGNLSITGDLQLSTGQKITAVGYCLITFTSGSAFKLASSCMVSGIDFSGPVGSYAVTATGKVDYVKIIDVGCTTCGLVSTNKGIGYSTIDWVTRTNVCSMFTIQRCSGYSASGTVSDNVFIDTRYIDGVVIDSIRVVGYHFGQMYWGGNSNFSNDGGLRSNARKCDNIILTNSIFLNCLQSATWGSMGGNVRRTNVIAIRDTLGGDVGIDDEGTVSSVNVGCYARGYTNGNYSVFFGGTYFSMTDCVSHQYAGRPHYRHYNSGQDPLASADVVITGGEMKTIDPANGFATVDTNNGPARSLVISGVSMTDTLFNSISLNGGYIELRELNMIYSVQQPAGTPPLINIRTRGSYGCSVIGIRFQDVTTPANLVVGIKVDTADSNGASRVIVSDTRSMYHNIEILESGTNSAISGIFFVYDNICTGITRTNSGARPLVLARSDQNYTRDGTPIVVA